MRLFFGLKPDMQTCLDIDHWRRRTLPPLDRPVPPQNLHMTLAFLGDVDDRKLASLESGAGLLQESEIALRLDQLGYFPKPQILWIGPSETPASASSLARRLLGIGSKLGLRTERRQFKAHLTIARGCRTPPPASAEPPAFDVSFDSFALFESVDARSGVQYRVVREWELGHG